MKDFLDNFAAVIGAATLALLLFSVCHEYGYFWIIGSHFQTFASTSDYFTNSTQWLVAALFLMWGWVDWKATFGLQSYYAPLSKDWRTWLFPAVVGIPYLTLTFFAPSTFPVSLFFIFTYVWLVYGVKKVPFATAEEPLYKRLRAVLIAMPVVAVLAFVTGQMKASSALA